MPGHAYDLRDKLPKYKKSEVGFQYHVEGGQKCAGCSHFEVFSPDRCAIVNGIVLDGDWCQRWKKI